MRSERISSISRPSCSSPGLSGAIDGLVVEDDRRCEHHLLAADEHRPDADVLAAGRDRPRPLRRLQQRQEPALGHRQHGVRRHQGVPQRLLPRPDGRGGRVLDPGAHPQHVRAGEDLRGEVQHRVERLTLAHDPADGRACGVADRLLGALGRDPDRDALLARGQPRHVHRGVDLHLDGLVPAEQPLPGDRELRDRGEPVALGALHRLALDVQEPHPDVQDGAVPGFEQHLCLVRRRFPALGPARRHQHAELPAHLVLRGGRPVRVEQVALEQHCVGDAEGGVEDCHSSTPACLSSAAKAASHVGSAPRALNRCSASSVSRCTRIQPLPGKKRSINSRHTATGTR